MKKQLDLFKISFTGFMISLTLILEIMNRLVPLRAPWGMSIDFVAIPLIITFFIFGIKYALFVSLGMFIILTAIGYGGIIGAVMKTVCSTSMIIILWIISKISSKYTSMINYTIASLLAIITRCIIAIILNYYWAIPLFFGIPIEKAIETLFFGSIIGFIVYVSIMNIGQGIIDLYSSWIIFKTIERIKIIRR
jgi:riboflavin transporter FmnP